MVVGSSSSSDNPREDRIIVPGLEHVKVYITNKKKSKCDDENNIQHVKDPASIIYPNRSKRSQEEEEEEEEEERPPYIIVVHGPPKVGKSLLIKSLLKYYFDHDEVDVQGPLNDHTILLGNRRRIQFVECPNNVNGMIDAAKYADAVMLLIDAKFGFEMETFEFLNILQVHGIPKVMGVLTYLDGFKNAEKLIKTKHCLMDQFCTEIYEVASLFCLSGLDQGMYQMDDIEKLASFISVMDFHPLSWRATQPYVLVKCLEDVTPLERADKDYKCNRDIILYGYLRGCDIKNGTKVHIAGVGDFPLFGVTSLPDPFPSPYTPQKIIFRDTEIFKIEGFRTGSYLKLEVRNVPFEMVKSFDPCNPILVGGIGSEEENAGLVQVALKRHNWHRKLLQRRDPIIVSIGWRRYQTSPIYAMEDSHGRLQMVNDTPKDEQCHAIFWGPRAPPNSRVVVVQSLADHEAAFRILATAVVLDYSHAPKIFYKCNRIGTPCEIIEKTAFINDLFTSDLQIDEYKNQRIQTNSGIRGKIKKAAGKELVDRLKLKGLLPREGITKCTFEQKIHMNDTVILHVWKQVAVSRFFNPLMIALDLSDRIWRDSILPHMKPVDRLNDPPMPVSKDLINKQEDIEEEHMSWNRQKEEFLKKLEEKNKAKMLEEYPPGSRRTLERRRRVLIVEGEPSVQTLLKVRWYCSQVCSDLIFERGSELPHNGKNGSVYFSGYKSELGCRALSEEPVEDSKAGCSAAKRR